MDKYLLALTLIPEIGPITLKKCLDLIGSPEEIWQTDFQTWKNLGFSERLSEILSQAKNEFNPDKLLNEFLESGITTTCYNEDSYPANLKNLDSSPLILYYRGNLDILNNRKILAVVGSRKISTYGQQIIPSLLEPLKNLKITIASGLAFGVDRLAHEWAVQLKLPTVGVLGSGLAWTSFYPKENKKLAEQILASGGLIVSEMPADYQAMPFDFPRRNRLIAGLCDVCLVIEAAQKSGALITARMSAEQNKEVLAVPQNINLPNAKGVNSLLQAGAVPVLTSEDIAYALGFGEVNRQNNPLIESLIKNLSPEEKLIYDLLSLEELSLDDLIERSDNQINNLFGVLLNLEIKGLIKNNGEQRYLKI